MTSSIKFPYQKKKHCLGNFPCSCGNSYETYLKKSIPVDNSHLSDQFSFFFFPLSSSTFVIKSNCSIRSFFISSHGKIKSSIEKAF